MIFRLFLFVTLLSFFSSCSSDWAKKLKNGTISQKDSAAIHYFNVKNYDLAQPAIEELYGLYRGTARAKQMLFFLAFCHYYKGEYITSAFYFKEFATQYSGADEAEEATFMIAKCYEKQSAAVPLDQSETTRAIESFQLFSNQYPLSQRRTESDAKIDELKLKLVEKAFKQADLYLKIGYYKSAVVAFKNFISDYPGSDKREEAQFKLIKASFAYAKMSVETKQLERMQEVIDFYLKFADRYAGSKWKDEAQSLHDQAKRFIEKSQKITKQI